MNLNSPMVQCDGLRQIIPTEIRPGIEVAYKGQQARFDLVKRHAEVDVRGSHVTSPLPNVAEHLFMQLQQPGHVKPRLAPAWPLGEIFDDGPADIFRLD